MARPAKAIGIQSKHNTQQEIEVRTSAEQLLKGKANNVRPPNYLNEEQKQIFYYIVDELKASGILGNLDIFILSTCSIAINRLQNIEMSINKDFNNIYSKEVMSAKDKYTKDLYRCCNELSLSPQARAKIGNINLLNKQDQGNPIINIINGGKSD